MFLSKPKSVSGDGVEMWIQSREEGCVCAQGGRCVGERSGKARSSGRQLVECGCLSRSDRVGPGGIEGDPDQGRLRRAGVAPRRATQKPEKTPEEWERDRDDSEDLREEEPAIRAHRTVYTSAVNIHVHADILEAQPSVELVSEVTVCAGA